MSAPPGPTISVSSRTINRTQEGYTVVDVGWVEGVAVCRYPFGGFHSITGLRYELQDGLTPQYPRVYSLTLSVTYQWGAMPVRIPGEIWVAMQNDDDPDVFGADNLIPSIWDNGAYQLAGTGWTSVAYDDGAGWSSTTSPSTIQLSLGTAILDPVNGTTLYDLSGLMLPIESGRINLGIQIDTSNGNPFGVVFALATESLTVEEFSFHTGIMVSDRELQRRARVVHSYKSAFPYLSDEAVPDGFTDGIMMHPDDYDPIDPVAQGHGAYVSPATEGVVDDEISEG